MTVQTLQDVLDLVDATELPKIRAGETHRFNDIWIVVADGRLFCRQYSLAARSWYSAFLEDPRGAIQCGDEVIEVEARVPDDLDRLRSAIDEAYLDKHERRFDRFVEYAHEIVKDPYAARTMELVPVLRAQAADQ